VGIIDTGIFMAIRKYWLYVFLFVLMLFSSISFAQAPVISYSTPTNIYTVGTAITSLSPTNTGGAVPATTYAQVTTLVASGPLNSPFAIATDGSGNIYVADYGNSKIRKITSAGVMTTLAGSGIAGELDGTGTAAKFNGPDGIAYDGSGNLYVADAVGNVIRKVVIATGVVTTYAGTGATGHANGTLLASTFNAPDGLTFDASGNLYIADFSNNLIRMISGTTVSTFAGGLTVGGTTPGSANGTGTTATFSQPIDLVADGSGNLFVADYANNLIREIVISTKVVTTFAGSGAAAFLDGTGIAAKFSSPASICLDPSGNLLVADQNNNRIRQITTAAVVTTLAGSGTSGETNGTGVAATFAAPVGITIDNSGNCYIADWTTTTTGSVRKIVLTGYTISPVLPVGLSFDGTTGIITGTPTVASAATNYTITGYNASGSDNFVISIACGVKVAWKAGSNTTAWATPGNWSPAVVPGVNDAVSIGVSAYLNAKEPSITAADVTVGSITFGNSGGSHSLTVTSPRTLTISSYLTVPTGITPTITGTGAINISPGAMVNITGTGVLNTTLTGKFTLKSDATGSASIGQIASTSIAGAGASSITVERFVTGGSTYSAGRWVYRNYRLLSSPVNEGIDASGNYPYSVNYLAASTIITDCTSSFGTTTGNPSLYLFNETYTPNNGGFTTGNYIGVTNISNTVASGHITTTDATNSSAKVYVGDGVMMYFRGDKVTNIAGTPSKTKYPYVAPESVTFSTTGTLNQGTYSVVSWTGSAGLMYTISNAGNALVRGYNLVGNPYASSIDWNLFSNVITNAATAPIYGANVNPTIYILNPITNNFDTYTATTHFATGSASNIIPSGQGFFVSASGGSPTLTFRETAKTNAQVTGNSLLMGTPASESAYNSFIRLKLVTDSINYADMIIGFNSSSTAKYNANEDVQYLRGSGAPESISSTTCDNVKTSIKWLPLPKNTLNEVIKLNVGASATGLYKLQRTDFKEIPAIYEVWLMDRYKKDSLDIRNNTTYAFNVDLTDTASFGSNRFEVVILENPQLRVHLLDFSAAKANNGAQIVWKTENEQNYTNFTVERSTDGGVNFNVLGGFASSDLGTYSFLDKAPPVAADRYRLKLEDLNGTISYSNIVTLMYANANSLVKNNISLYPNPAKNTLNLTIIPAYNSNSAAQGGNPIVNHPVITAANTVYGIKIVNTLGTVVKMATTNKPDWQTDISSLMPGNYVIQVVNGGDNSIVGKGTFIKL
jgi:sugar lactone lactonase YvrE